MAAFAFNTSNVRASSTAQVLQGVAGQDILAGRPVYLNTAVSPSQWFMANSATTSATNLAGGVAVCSANTNQSFFFVTRDSNFSPGYAINTGIVAVVGNVAGQVNPVTDTGAGWGYIQVLGVGIGGNNINFIMVGTNANI